MLGICYYPEHWPETMWAQDAAEMYKLGIRYVRIAEFAWSRMEPNPGEYQFAWLDRAINTLADAGLKVVMCTPTATPPKWLIDLYPSILPVDVKTGHSRGFGSRRHYDFSSTDYFREAMRISTVLVERYGQHPAIVGWQTDNEIACHDTTHSGSTAALQAFRKWCQQQYLDIEALNSAWGNVFWSMEYRHFDEIELPILAVTETNPAHQLAFRRFSSDQVVRFHDEMVKILRSHAPGRFVTHNFIPMVDTQADNYALAEPLDFASFDNYPLGRSDLFFAKRGAAMFKPYMRTGHPDFSSYYFDQTRGLTGKHFWIMEQQPGPVNWARHNPRPEVGMVRLWSWVSFAHGADVVSYFRWRQAPFAQEQMHAGLKRVDNSKAAAWPEIEQLVTELALCPDLLQQQVKAQVAIVSTTENQWVCEIERQGESFNQQEVEFAWYSALRQLGVDVDFVSPEHDLTGYKMVLAPCMPVVRPAFVERCQASGAVLVFGPRTGSKTTEFQLAPNLAPGLLQSLIPVKVLSVETIRPDCAEPLFIGDAQFKSQCWREELEVTSDCTILARYHDGLPAVAQHQHSVYIATVSCDDFLKVLFTDLLKQAHVNTLQLPKDVRLARRGALHFLFNYSAEPTQVSVHTPVQWLLGSATLQGYGVAIYRL